MVAARMHQCHDSGLGTLLDIAASFGGTGQPLLSSDQVF
jgi:hypothetical protein